MTIRLTLSEVETLRKIRQGVKRCPPLIWRYVASLIRKGYIKEHVVNGDVVYLETDKGKAFP